MASITIKPDNISVDATDGELLVTVAARAGAALRTDCGAQGACRKCAVVLESGSVAGKDDEPVEHRPVEGGQEILTCQCVVDGDATLHIPPENRAADLAPFAKTLGRVAETLESSGARRPLAMRRCVVIPPPDKGDSVTDLDRVFDALRLQDPRLRPLSADLSTLQILPETLRKSNWRICANVVDGWCESRLIDVREAGDIGKPTFGLAIDIGTSTVAVTIISLETGRVVAAEGLRNGQIRHGDDVISRIIWSQENEDGLGTMRRDVVETLNKVIGKARESVGIAEDDIIAASVAGNSTMMNFLLGIPAGPIRRDPHTPPASWLPLFRADELGLDVWQG
ncbi:MAG TPA: 2Fe-2S iron-sulfur cluster-binding protein, partial [Armatimonadota bacterium]|nr:2Fe-2S iron-sulfur cluster-binding protein [Armatimonadota bacterium]